MINENTVRDYLAHYKLTLNYYEQFGKVLKVHTNNGVFAIKIIPATKGTDFVYQIRQLYQKGYSRIVPVFATVDHKYGVVIGDKLWYLQPWLPNNQQVGNLEHDKQMMRELARIHTMTVTEVTVDKEERENYYFDTIELWESRKEFLEEFLVLSEKKWSMSPFELQYCSYHADIIQALGFAIKKLEEWYEVVLEETKVRMVLTHGKASGEHFLFSEDGYGHFINLEDATTATPHFDLLPFIVGKLNTYPRKANDVLEIFDYYFKFFSWTEGEMLLFVSYLANPESSIKIVEEYYSKKHRSDAKMCRALQLEFWLLKNTEYFIMQWEQRKQLEKTHVQNESAQNKSEPAK